MKAKQSRDDMESILCKGFDYLMEHGIENASLRSIAEGIGCSPANLYNYFENKDDCIIEIAKFGFIKTATALVEYSLDNIADLKNFFDTFIDQVDYRIDELRTVYQVATSPIYGERMRAVSDELKPAYSKLLTYLATLMNCSEKLLFPVIFNFISIILDYAVWRDRECTTIQLQDLYEVMIMKFKNSMK